MQNKTKIFSFLILLIVSSLVWSSVLEQDRTKKLRVSFLDVGQGDAIFIEAPNGNQVLIDGGPDNKILRSLSKELPFYDREIDMVLSTHSDCDHVGGLPAVLKRYNVFYSGFNGVSSDSLCFREYREAIEKENIENDLFKRGDKIYLSKNVYLEVLFPDRDFSESGIDPNLSSLFLRLVYLDTSFLLTGDAPKKIEEFVLLLENGVLESDVLKVGHHGSDTSTAVSLLGLASPYYAVISVGENNSYNHPNEEVLEKLKNFDIEVLQTKDFGNITFISNGKEINLINPKFKN